MNKIAPLTIEQFRSLYQKEYAPNSLFNPVAAPDGSYFISEEEINAYSGTTYAWVKSLPLIDYTTNLPDTTVPNMTNMGVLLPTEVDTLELFPNNQFKLGGYVITLTETQQGLAVDLAYLQWQGFRDEQDKPYNEAIKATFSALWYTLLGKVQNNEIIQL